MNKLILILPIFLAGCAKVSDYQTKCEQQYQKFSDMASCLDNSVKTDSRMSGAATSKLYVLTAKMLGEGVDQGKISDSQARLELQNLYVNMQRQESVEQQASAQAIQQGLLNAQTINTMQAIEQKTRQPTYIPPVQLRNSNMTTNCSTYGNQTRCQSY